MENYVVCFSLSKDNRDGTKHCFLKMEQYQGDNMSEALGKALQDLKANDYSLDMWKVMRVPLEPENPSADQG